MKGFARRALRVLHLFEDGLLALLLLALVLLAAAQIFLRIGFDGGMSFADPVARALVLWVGLLGALAATREGKHISLDLLSTRLAGKQKRAAQCVSALVGMVVCAILGWYAIKLVQLEMEAPVVWALGMSSWVPQLILPFAFFAMALRFGLSALLGREPPA